MCTAFIISGAIYAFSRFWTEMMSVPVRDFLCLSQLPWTILIAHLSRSNLGDAGNQRAELARSCLPFHAGTARFSTSKKVLPAGCPSQHHKLVLRSCFDEQIYTTHKAPSFGCGFILYSLLESRQIHREPNLEIEWSW